MATYLGQNFLVDAKVKACILQKICALAKTCDALIEIGPGKGALTTKMCQITPFFLAIEKDEAMVSLLMKKIPDFELVQGVQKFEEQGKNTILFLDQQNHTYLTKGGKKIILVADVLEVDVFAILKQHKLAPEKTFIVGNLPYYITSPILRKFFGTKEAAFAGGCFVVQKEVGEKLATTATKKSYLRWLVNYAHTVTYEKTIGPKAFSPQPKVTSCMISIAPKKQDDTSLICFDALLSFLDQYSQFKRKTLGAATKILEKKAKKTLHQGKKEKIFLIPPFLQAKRLEELTREDVKEIMAANERTVG